MENYYKICFIKKDMKKALFLQILRRYYHNESVHNRPVTRHKTNKLSQIFMNSQEYSIKSKNITTNLTNPYFILATFRACFFIPILSFNDEEIKVQVLQ